MSQGKRRPWLDSDNTTLISLWDVVGSVALIAIMMERTPSSVQTQASRLGLPQRAEERDRHRRRWVHGDDDYLDIVVVELTLRDGKIPIHQVADRMGRSVDAIVARLISRHGEDSDIMSRLMAPKPKIKPVEDVIKLTVQSKMQGKEGKQKKCLKCRDNFWSPGNHIWVCKGCKRSEDWSVD